MNTESAAGIILVCEACGYELKIKQDFTINECGYINLVVYPCEACKLSEIMDYR